MHVANHCAKEFSLNTSPFVIVGIKNSNMHLDFFKYKLLLILHNKYSQNICHAKLNT